MRLRLRLRSFLQTCSFVLLCPVLDFDKVPLRVRAVSNGKSTDSFELSPDDTTEKAATGIDNTGYYLIDVIH